MISMASQLKESFDNYAYDYLSSWEHDPDMEIINNEVTGRDPKVEAREREMVELFWGLRDTVDAIPAAMIADVEKRRASLGDEEFYVIIKRALESVGIESFPKNAADFVGTLILNLQFAVIMPQQLRHAL